MTDTDQDINTRQLDDEHRLMRRALATAHRHSARWWIAKVVVAGALTVASFTAELFSGPHWAGAVWGISAAVFVEFIWPSFANRSDRVAATIQDEFDRSLFRLPPPPDGRVRWTKSDLHALARRSAPVDDGDGWYLDVRGVAEPVARLICQWQNLRWDNRLRARWGLLVGGAVATWLFVAVLVGTLLDQSLREWLVVVIVPSLPLMIVGAHEAASNISLAREKAKYAESIEDTLRSVQELELSASRTRELARLAEEVQVFLCEGRKGNVRVPSWYYKRSRANNHVDFNLQSADWRRIWTQDR